MDCVSDTIPFVLSLTKGSVAGMSLGGIGGGDHYRGRIKQCNERGLCAGLRRRANLPKTGLGAARDGRGGTGLAANHVVAVTIPGRH